MHLACEPCDMFSTLHPYTWFASLSKGQWLHLHFYASSFCIFCWLKWHYFDYSSSQHEEGRRRKEEGRSQVTMELYIAKCVAHRKTGRRGRVEWWCHKTGKMLVRFNNNKVELRWINAFVAVPENVAVRSLPPTHSLYQTLQLGHLPTIIPMQFEQFRFLWALCTHVSVWGPFACEHFSILDTMDVAGSIGI